MKWRNSKGRPDRRYDPSGEIPADFNPGASKPGGTINRRPLSGSERYKREDDLASRLDRLVKDSEK